MVGYIWKLCTFKAFPEEMPFSIPLFLAIICINFSILFFIISITTGSILVGIWKTLLLQAVIAAFTLLILHLRGYIERSLQVLSGLYASQSLILGVCLIPYLILITLLPDVGSNFYYFLGLTVSVVLLIIASIWLFMAYASIFESALEFGLNASLLISIILFSVCALIFGLLYL